jgi:hypothetical protein
VSPDSILLIAVDDTPIARASALVDMLRSLRISLTRIPTSLIPQSLLTEKVSQVI